jgi:hypothetical protein
MIIKAVLQWQAEKPPGSDVAWILEKNLWQRIDGRANETTKASSAWRKQAEPRRKI